MNETGFKCPKCGQTEHFTASDLVIAGPIDVSPNGYEPKYGHGLHYELPDYARMWCHKCMFEAGIWHFRKACTDEWWPKD